MENENQGLKRWLSNLAEQMEADNKKLNGDIEFLRETMLNFNALIESSDDRIGELESRLIDRSHAISG